MKKKFLIVLLSIVSSVCIAFGVAACSGDSGSGNSSSGGGSSQTSGETGGNSSPQEVHTHVYTFVSNKEATCSEDGNIAYQVCEECGKYFSASDIDTELTWSQIVIPATGDHYSFHYEAAEATCEYDGNIEYWYCYNCGKYFSDEDCTNEITTGVTIAATGHTATHTEAKDATCATAGNIEYWYCSDCGQYFSDEACENKINSAVTISATGEHTYGSDDLCTVCGRHKPTEGLTYTYNGGYYSVSIGEATDTEIYIAEMYNDGENGSYPVTDIAYEAFRYNTTITSITIPDSITYIGRYAFSECTALESVTIPSSVTSIMDYAFSGCSALKSITIPDGVTRIYYDTFYGCTSLKSVTIGSDVTSIDDAAFRGCSALESVTFGENSSVTSIGRYAFYGCSALTSITIPDGVTSIGESAFRGCTGLTSVTIPANVTAIGDYAFSSCDALATVTFGEGSSLTSIGSYAFYGCTALTSITIPDGVTSIGSSTFYDCYLLESITIPDGVTSIGSSTFYNCYLLESITFGEGSKLETIGSYAFYDCYMLTSITIPEGVTSIGNDAFSYCCKLVEVYNLSSLTITAGSTDNGYVAYYAKNVYTAASGSSYITTQDGYEFFVDSDNNTYCLVSYTGSDTQLTLPTLTDSAGNTINYSIYQYTFFKNTKITSINIPSNVTSIGNHAFGYCDALESVTIGSGVTTIDNYAFEYCPMLISVTIGSGVTSIGTSTFYCCRKLVEVYNLSSLSLTAKSTDNGYVAYYAKVIHTSADDESHLLTQDDYMFVYDDSDNYYLINYLGSSTVLILPTLKDNNGSTITYSIIDYCFYENEDITVLTIPSGVTAIGACICYNCTSLVSITIGSDITSIGTSAFDGCTAIDSIFFCATSINSVDADIFDFAGQDSDGIYVTISANVTRIPADLFYSNHSANIVKVVFDDNSSCTAIGNYAFCGCSALTSITIPNGVTSIGEYAFSQCSKFTSIVIPNSVTTIGSYAFGHCTLLTSVTIGSGVTTIDYYAFLDCSKLIEVYNLSSLTITAGNTDNGYVAYYAKNVYTAASGSSYITTQDGYVLYMDNDNGTYYLVSYTGSDTQLTLPTLTVSENTVNYSIYNNAFSGCNYITSIVIPNSVTSIGSNAFLCCNSLKSVYYDGTASQWASISFGDMSSNPLYNGGNLYLKDASSETGYSLAEEITIEGISAIGAYAFEGCKSIKSVTIGSGVTSIGDDAFENCTALTSITIPAGVTSIGVSAFYDCYSLTTVTFGENSALTSIDTWAFGNCYLLTSITIPSSVTSIGDYAFYNCTALESISIPANVTSIGYKAFYNCSKLTSITIPANVTYIGYNAFYGCSALTSITFEDTTGWWYANSSTATEGTDLTLTDASANATYLKSTYTYYYWHKTVTTSEDAE